MTDVLRDEAKKLKTQYIVTQYTGIVIDSNILFSALLKNSETRRIILTCEILPLFFPSYLFEELERHKKELILKSGMSYTDFDQLLELLIEKIIVVPDARLSPFRKQAMGLVHNIDHDDAIFVACALAIPNSILWSNDKKLKTVKHIKVLNTQEIIKLLRV